MLRKANRILITELFHQARKDTRCKCCPKHFFELLIEAADAHLLEVEVAAEERVVTLRQGAILQGYIGKRPGNLLPNHICGDQQLPLNHMAVDAELKKHK